MASRRTSRRPKRTSRKPTKRTSRGARTLKRNGGLSDFTSAYIDTALWLTADETDERQLNGRERDLDPHTRHQMELDAATFFEEHRDTWDGIDDARAGRNFWLSRNGHGTGFFDEYDLSAATRKKLQTASKKFGEFDLYVGDDRKIHGSPLEQMPLEANVIPPPPVRGSDLEDWALRTFAPDTRVRLRADLMFAALDDRQDTVVFPAGTVGTVLGIAGSVLIVGVSRQQSMLFSTSAREYERTFGISPGYVQDTIRWLEPLDDNWGTAPAPLKQRQLPASQRGLSMKHRRLMPNASEHSVWAKFKGSADRDPALSEPEKDSLAKLIESEAPIDWTIDSSFSNDEPVHVSAWALFDSASKAMRFMAKVREWAEDYRVPVEVKSKSHKDDDEPAMKVLTVDDLIPRGPRLADPKREAGIKKSLQIADDVLDEMLAAGELSDEEPAERFEPPSRVESARGRLSLVKKPKKPRPNARTSHRLMPNANEHSAWKTGMITDDALAAKLPNLGPITTGKTDGKLQRIFYGCGLGHRHPSRMHALKCRDRWKKAEIARMRKELAKKPQPNARTSRRVLPNATCPSCGSPHYFESMWHRDCATPDCRYFRGGTVGGQPETPTRARPTGGRQILVTYDTLTPESAAEGDYEDSGERSTIDIEAEDLDEDETWAEYAANVIKKELGHVDDNGDGTYYQSEWHVTDYGTGEEERLAAHLHPPSAWAGDLDEIHELLKQWRLL